ncbi:hypothetical protein C8R42DRAFT_728251 [Lentinula raphanica]|nr:hypothetical protein C8R42DRAFT_728251 [Lentinula raphanica]
MQLFLHTKFKLILLVRLLLFVVNAAPVPISSSGNSASSSSSSSNPNPSNKNPLFDAYTLAYNGPPPEPTEPYMAARLVVYNTNNRVESKSFNSALAYAAQAALTAAMPTLIGDLPKTFKGLKYDPVHPPVLEPITQFKEYSEGPARQIDRQIDFYKFVISFSGRDNNWRYWVMPSIDYAYTLTISKDCVWQDKREKWYFLPNALRGDLAQYRSKEVLVQFKYGQMEFPPKLVQKAEGGIHPDKVQGVPTSPAVAPAVPAKAPRG